MKRKICPCCGYYTVESDDEVIVDICDVCFWQYDVVAHENPDISIGANHISLTEARKNYKLLGHASKGLLIKSEPHFLKNCLRITPDLSNLDIILCLIG